MDFLRRIFLPFSSIDMAIDLGTANTLIHIKGRGLVVDEPSIVTVQYDGSKSTVIAIGKTAREMLGRTPANTKTIRPLRDGVIADFESTATMIKYFIKKATDGHSFFLTRPRIVVCVPSGATQVERRVIKEAAESVGAGKVFLIKEPVAAALGAGLPVTEPVGSMIVDIGGGTSEIAILSLGGVVYSESVRIGGDAMNMAISDYIRRNSNLLIGEITAENIKISIGSAIPAVDDVDERTMRIKGRDLINGIPKEVIISESQISDALSESINNIILAIRTAMEYVEPEIAADIADSGITLAGGGALLRSLSRAIGNSAKLSVRLADDPRSCVASGIGICLDDLPTYGHLLEQ